MSTPEVLFSIGNALILPCWAMLIVFPRSRATRMLFGNPRRSPALALAVLYAIAVIPALFASPESFAVLARPTLDGVRSLLGSEQGVAAGWIHYLCFDLLAGISVWKSAREKQQSFRWVSPLLVLVLMLGPFGWLMYQLASGLIPSQGHPGAMVSA